MDYPTPKKIFIGVSWPYVNGNIHLGHLAGQNVACDVFARYHRLRGHDVLMVSGSDSHGTPVIFKAEELKMTPADLAAKYHNEIVKTFEKLGFIYENYTRTTTDNHKAVVQNIFLVLKELGYLEVRESEQYYDSKVKRFLPDRYVRGTCPNCKEPNARGDECPQCGAFLNPTDLIDPYSTLSDSTPKLKKTKHFYMTLEKLEGDISKYVRANNRRWRKWVREFTKGWVKQGLEARAVTRDLTFGVKVPVEGWEDKVIYVWIEAVVGYLSAAIEWAANQKNPALWEEFWKNPECEHYYFIAGGNVPFHTIMWPAELLAYNKKYGTELEKKYLLPGESASKPLNLPFDVPANKMLFFKGKKMSKGDGTGIGIDQLLQKYDPDIIRYFFVRYGPENHDREYIWRDFIDANNNELVANIGNFINRSLTFLHTKFNGIVPDNELEPEVKDKINETFSLVGQSLEKSEFIKAAELILELGHFANKYFNDRQPWITIKSEKSAAEKTIYNTIQLVNSFRVLLKPFTPNTVKRLGEILGVTDDYDPTEEVRTKGRVSKYIDQWYFNKLPSGIKIKTPTILFEKLEYTDDLKAVDGSLEQPKRGNNFNAANLVVAPELNALPIVTTKFKGLKVSRSNKNLNTWIEEYLKIVNPKQLKDIDDKYMKLHDQYSKVKGIPSSSAGLRENFAKGKQVKVNTFVDLYNAISYVTGISFGAHDIDKLDDQIQLDVLKEKTQYEAIGKIETYAESGEYAYIDSTGIVCRLDVKQGERTKVTTKTKNVYIIAQGHDKMKKEEVEKAVKLLEENVVKFFPDSEIVR